MRERVHLDTFATLAIIVAAFFVAFAALDRVRTRDVAQPLHLPSVVQEPELSSEPIWEEIREAGVRTGNSTASVEVVEFVDLECPFCRRSHLAFMDAMEKLGDDVAYIFVHDPLASHRFSRLAAAGAECAHVQGRFIDFLQSAFTAQDSLGLIPWESLARRAGVPNIDEFSHCLHYADPSERIEAGRLLGDRIGILATPTVIINRWRLPRPPYDDPVAVIQDILHGRSPYRVEEEG